MPSILPFRNPTPDNFSNIINKAKDNSGPVTNPVKTIPVDLYYNIDNPSQQYSSPVGQYTGPKQNVPNPVSDVHAYVPNTNKSFFNRSGGSSYSDQAVVNEYPQPNALPPVNSGPTIPTTNVAGQNSVTIGGGSLIGNVGGNLFYGPISSGVNAYNQVIGAVFNPLGLAQKDILQQQTTAKEGQYKFFGGTQYDKLYGYEQRGSIVGNINKVPLSNKELLDLPYSAGSEKYIDNVKGQAVIIAGLEVDKQVKNQLPQIQSAVDNYANTLSNDVSNGTISKEEAQAKLDSFVEQQNQTLSTNANKTANNIISNYLADAQINISNAEKTRLINILGTGINVSKDTLRQTGYNFLEAAGVGAVATVAAGPAAVAGAATSATGRLLFGAPLAFSLGQTIGTGVGKTIAGRPSQEILAGVLPVAGQLGGFLVGAKIAGELVNKPIVDEAIDRAKIGEPKVSYDTLKNIIKKFELTDAQVKIIEDAGKKDNTGGGTIAGGGGGKSGGGGGIDTGVGYKVIEVPLIPDPNVPGDSALVPIVKATILEITDSNGRVIERVGLGNVVGEMGNRIFTRDLLYKASGILDENLERTYTRTFIGKYKNGNFKTIEEARTLDTSEIKARSTRDLTEEERIQQARITGPGFQPNSAQTFELFTTSSLMERGKNLKDRPDVGSNIITSLLYPERKGEGYPSEGSVLTMLSSFEGEKPLKVQRARLSAEQFSESKGALVGAKGEIAPGVTAFRPMYKVGVSRSQGRLTGFELLTGKKSPGPKRPKTSEPSTKVPDNAFDLLLNPDDYTNPEIAKLAENVNQRNVKIFKNEFNTGPISGLFQRTEYIRRETSSTKRAESAAKLLGTDMTEIPKMTGGTGEGKYSQAIYGYKYGELFGSHKENIANVNTGGSGIIIGNLMREAAREVSPAKINLRPQLFNQAITRTRTDERTKDTFGSGLLIAGRTLTGEKNKDNRPSPELTLVTDLGKDLTREETGVIQVISPVLDQGTKQKQRQQQQQENTFDFNFGFNLNLPGSRPPTEPPGLYLTTKKESSKGKGRRGLFTAFVRRKGKFNPVGTSSSFGGAFGIGKSVAERTLARSFEVKNQSGSLIPLPETNVFRPQLRRGKVNPFISIQRSRFSLSSSGEKSEIRQARRAAQNRRAVSIFRT